MESNRSVLEVLGFLAALEILRCTSCVSQHCCVSNSNEIWNSLCHMTVTLSTQQYTVLPAILVFRLSAR